MVIFTYIMLFKRSIIKIVTIFVVVTLTALPAVGLKYGLSFPNFTPVSGLSFPENFTHTDKFLPTREPYTSIPSVIEIPTIVSDNPQFSSIKDSLHGSLLYTIQEPSEHLDSKGLPLAPILQPAPKTRNVIFFLEQAAIVTIKTATHFIR